MWNCIEIWPSELRLIFTLLETNRYSCPLKIDALVGRWFEISFFGAKGLFSRTKKLCCFLFRESVSVYILRSHGNISPDVPNGLVSITAWIFWHVLSWRLVGWSSQSLSQILWSNKGNAPLLAISRVVTSINGLFKWVNRVITCYNPTYRGYDSTYNWQGNLLNELFLCLFPLPPARRTKTHSDPVIPFTKFWPTKKQYLAILLVTCFGMVSFKVTKSRPPVTEAEKKNLGSHGWKNHLEHLDLQLHPLSQIMGVYLETPHEPRRKKTTLLSMSHPGWLMTGSWILMSWCMKSSLFFLGSFGIPYIITPKQPFWPFFHCKNINWVVGHPQEILVPTQPGGSFSIFLLGLPDCSSREPPAAALPLHFASHRPPGWEALVHLVEAHQPPELGGMMGYKRMKDTWWSESYPVI